MSNSLAIHNLRQQVGTERQPEHADRLSELQEIIGSSHPYTLSQRARELLKLNPAFGEGGTGKQIDPPEQEYLYRLTSIGAVKHLWSDPKRRSLQEDDIFRELWTAYNPGGPWLKLATYAQGTLESDRGITWWTNLEMNPEDLLSDASRIGIPSGFVAPQSLLLRCPTNYFSYRMLLHIPTVLDAFDSEIFHPTESKRNPVCGETICLKKTGPLTTEDGANEFIAKPIEVEYIEFIPVEVTREMRIQTNVVELCADLRRLLEDFYKLLLPVT